MVDDLRKLYDSVSNEYDVGDYESFRDKMKTSDDRKSFYDVIAKNGFDLGDYSMYEKRLSRSFEENNPQRQDGFWNTYLGDLIEKVGAGAADFGGSMYSILDKTYDTVLKPYVQLFTGKSNEDSWLKKQTDSSYEYANALRERADRYSGEDFIDLLNKGDYTEAVGDVFLQASESLPQSIMAMFMGGTGLALTGASAGSRKYDQLDSMPETKDMPVYSKAINAIVTGATEALTEKIGDVQIGKWLKGLYTKKGKDFVEKTIKNNLGDFIQKQFKSHGLLLAPVSEGAEEYIGQIVENITDYCTGLTNEWNPMEGTLESFVYGAGGGAQFASAGVPGILANKYKRFDYRKKYNKAKDVVRDAFPGEDISNFEEGIMSMSVEEQMNVLDAMDKDPSLSDRQKQAAFDFVQKANDYRSYNTPEIKESERKSREELIIETQLRQFDERITPVASENGMIQSVNINGRENAVYITKGDVVPKVLNDGKTVVDVDKSSPELYYTDEEGKTQVIAPTNITSILSIDPVDGLRQQFEQNLREQIKLSKDIQAQQSMIENIQNGDEVMYQNEKGEIVEGVVEDASSNPEHVFIDGVAVPREMVRPIKNMEVNVESMTEQPVEALPDVPVETAPEYPVTKDGKIDYNTLLDQNPELFAEAWEKRSSPEKAKATLQRQSDNIVKKIESLNSKLDKETDLNKISDIEDEISILVDKKNRVDEIVKRYGIEEKPEQFKVPDGLNQAEYYDWVYRESDDINEILNAYSQLKEAKNPYNNLQEWQRQLIGKKIKADSYYRFGDRNNATPTIKTKWFSKDGLSLDILAKDLSQFGREVSEQDIIDFINENPTNTVNNNSEDIDKMGHRFSELASKSAGMKIGKPDSPTGKLFIDLLKAKSASVSSETLHAMENRLREYEQVQPPIASLEESVPAEMKNNDIPIEDLEAYEREMNEKNRNNVLDGNDKSVSLQNNNEQENEIPERVSQGEHGTEASEDGGQEESLYQLRARIEEASRDARESKSGRSEGRRAEEEINRFIESESKKNGVWVPIEDISNLGSPFVSGNENDVYLDRENGVLYKVNNLMNSGTLPELFKRIDLHNKFFPDTKYDLVGFTGFGDGRAVYPIYKQEFVDNAVFASPEEINDYMHSIGFERTVEAEYSNNEVTISDLRPRNVLKDSDGDIYVIDADFKAKEQQAENPINTEIERQELEVNTDPTEGQKEAGNYKMGHVKINGFDVTIEQPKGSVRSGTDQYGKEWSVTMNNTYGYIRGTKGKDGDHIDVFVGPNPESGNVFVIDQVNHDGSFDEHKVMMGFDSIDEAKAAYLSNYEDGWNGLGNITGVELEDFRKWVDTGTRKLKPFAEYKQVQESSHVIDSDISTSEYKPKDGKPIRFTKWKDGGLITKDDGQFCLIERVFTESGAFSFTSKKKIKSSNDVAYIFRQLETSSIENAFVVMVKKGKPVVIHAGMGTLNQTMVNNAAIKAAYDSIGPDYVAFVHNHPSGRLMASLQDQKALKTIKDMFPEGLVVDGIIINTISGEYATFDFSGSETSKMDDVVNNEIPIKLYSFDKVVFDENYDPRNTKKIKSSDDVAAFVSSQRLGKRGKLSYIIIDQSGRIVGNLHTLYAGIEGNENAIANEISSNVIRFGGVSAIPYGDFVLDSSTLKKLNRDISKASGGAVSLLDVVKIDGLHTESAIDNGVMESVENYQSGGGMDNDIRFRESVSENLEGTNKRFNEEEKEVEKVREAAEEIDFDNEDKLKFHNLISSGLFKFREGYQDRMLSVKKMQDVIEEKTGVKLPDYMNVYMYENTLSSRNTHETEFFRNNYLRPMTRAISELEESGLSRREIENYVILKHGLERNEYMNQREETKGVDYAGIEMVKNKLNEKVEDFIKRVEGHGVDELWKAINDANHFSIKKWFDSGMINKATYEKIRGMYEHYVPLRGFDEETASDVYEYFTSAGSPFNSPLRTAEGRRSRADSPFAYIASMAESSITGGNKNLMKLHLYRLAQKYPSGFMSVNEPWYEKVKRDGKEVYETRVPVYSDDINTYRENVEKFNKEMKELESKGLAVKGKNRLDIGMKISPFEADEHIVRVRLNGEDKMVYFHGDPRPAQAINGLNDESRKAGNTTRDKLYRSVGKLNRAMAANFTTRNPAFVVSNMTRDLIFAITALNIKEGGIYRNKFMLNIPKASGAICRYLNGNQDLSNPVDKMFKEFLENGGETGYTALYNIEKFKKMIDREVKNTTMNSAVKGGMRVVDFFSAANRWAEDLSRFSTFMTSREMGRSVLRSTADAKDVTVNFNRKGSGAMGAGFFRGLYLFFNAAVQSLDNFGRMGKAHKAKTFFTVMGYGAMGAVLPTLLRAMMGDDAEKEYCDLPDYVRKNNVCIYLGKGNGFLTIPLPIELRAFFGIGDAIYQCITGRDEGLSTAGDCLSGLIDLLPLNPVGGGGPLIPDAIKPIAQAYALNEDFTGKPIAKENAFNQLIPEYRKVYRGTSKWFVKSSEVLNSVTGGDFATRGLIDINPAKVEHLFESYFGGMEKTINQIFKTAFGDTEGKREARNVPIVNRFYNTGGDFAATAKVNERYFNVLDEVKEIDTRLREYNKAIASGENVDKALKGIKELVDDGSMERSKIVSFYAKEVKKIDNMIKSGNLSDDDMENLKEESMKVKRMLLEELQK